LIKVLRFWGNKTNRETEYKDIGHRMQNIKDKRYRILDTIHRLQDIRYMK
jgi:hypothetical protein